MAADPELVKAFGKIAIIVLPFIFLREIIDALTVRGKHRSGRKRRSASNEWFPILVVVGILLVLLYRGNQGAFWTLILPLAFVGTGLLLLFWRIRRQNERRFLEDQDTIEKLRDLRPSQFEEYIVLLYSRLGYSTERVGGSYDGGIDVIAKKDGVTEYIQCKKFITRQVSVHDVRDFYGAIVDKLPSVRGIFITTYVFTPEARKFCEGKPIELIDGSQLMERLHRAGVITVQESQKEICPRDGGTLVERQGKFGTFLGCSNFPRCTYTKSTG